MEVEGEVGGWKLKERWEGGEVEGDLHVYDIKNIAIRANEG